MIRKSALLALLITLTVALGALYCCKSQHSLTNLLTTLYEFEQNHNKKLYQEQKKALQTYYTSGAYENNIQRIADCAKSYFAKIPVASNSVIIFDVDDTAVYRFHTFDFTKFIWKNHPFLKDKQNNMGIPIKSILNLYNFIKTKKFKTIFLTGRSQNICKQTQEELEKAGYHNFEKVICMPQNIASNYNAHANWKLEERKKLSKSYNIAGAIGDRQQDFKGGYTGFKVKLPNYLY